ncbi:MAG: hypothetical protein IH840_03820 [Candidatus Heimdallarchaeota archaeon]|nr:hypothetical protein [Candidatus Heimdallarchaeota archaeon]
MTYSREGMRKYFLPIYIIWAFVSPTIIIMVINLSNDRLFSFYALFGLIWPLTFVVYPAFYASFQDSPGTFNLFWVSGIELEIKTWGVVFFAVAWIGPVIHLILALWFHKIAVALREEKKIGWGDYFAGFL